MPLRQLVVVLIALVTAATPPFLVGALAMEIDHDVKMAPSAIGVSVGLCYLVAAATCTVVGPWVDRIGADVALCVTCVASSAAMAIIAASPDSSLITVGLIMQGFPIALCQPAANLVLADLPAGRRRGLYFGIVQATIPASILICGLMLGLVAGGWGWRPAFGIVGALAVVGAIAGYRRRPPPRHWKSRQPRHVEMRPDQPGRTGLLLLGAGGLLGSATATVLPTFAPSAALNGGLTPKVVGAGIAVAGLACIGFRIGAAWLAGHFEPRYSAVGLALLLSCGVVGYVGIALSEGHTILVFVVIGYGLGWGWPGVFNLAVTAARPHAVGAVTGWTQSALFVGGMLGPTGFGVVAEHAGYSAAWAAVGALATLGAISFALAARQWRIPSRELRIGSTSEPRGCALEARTVTTPGDGAGPRRCRGPQPRAHG